jgi:uncharacterized protein YjbJ (UPF0337 family)
MKKILLASMAIIATTGLAACSEKSQNSIENAGSAVGNDVSHSVNTVGAKIDQGLDKTGDVIKNGTSQVSAAADQAAADAKRKAADAKEAVGGALENAGHDLKKN